MKSAEAIARKTIAPLYVLGLLGMLGILIAVGITRQYDGVFGGTVRSEERRVGKEC